MVEKSSRYLRYALSLVYHEIGCHTCTFCMVVGCSRDGGVMIFFLAGCKVRLMARDEW